MPYSSKYCFQIAGGWGWEGGGARLHSAQKPHHPSGAEAPPRHYNGEEESLASSGRAEIGQGEVLVGTEMQSMRKTLDNAKSVHAFGVTIIQSLPYRVAKAFLSANKNNQTNYIEFILEITSTGWKPACFLLHPVSANVPLLLL